MILGLLSRRLRTWLLLAVVAPVAARALEEAGERVAPRNPALGGALTKAASLARRPKARRGRAGAGRAPGR